MTTWKKESGFIWSMMGSAIGFANLLAFSAQCYRNGGGAFLIPFVAAMLLLGLPMLLLEGTIGHTMRLPIVSAFGKAAGRPAKIFGWLAVCAVATIGAFYIVLTGFSIAYAWYAGTSAIPPDTATFFKETFLKDSGSLSQFGKFSWPIFASTAAVCLFSWFVLLRNIRSGVEKICSLFLPLLCALTTLFALVTLCLPGSLEGIWFYLSPDLSKISDPALWRDVFGQVFFSFSLGLGIVTAYSRHTKSEMSIPRAMWYVAMGDLVVSVIAGFAIFGCIGYLSHQSGVPINELVQSDSSFEIGFVIFPKILQAFGPLLSPIIGVLFFFSVFIAGVTGVFSIMESVMGNIEVEFGTTRRSAATITTAILFLGALVFCFGNGQPILGALAPMVLGNNMLIGGLAEIGIFMVIYKGIKHEPIWESQRWAKQLLRFAIPPMLLIILGASIAEELQTSFGLPELVRWGWFGGALALSALLSLKPTHESAVARSL